MNGWLRDRRLWIPAGVLFANLAAAGVVHAALTPWVGYADYRAAPGADGGEDSVGPFSSYDFSNNGVLLVQPTSVQNAGSITVGDVYQGSYESYVTAHSDQQGNTAPAPNLNTGGGYELTVAATFNETITNIDPGTGNAVFSVTGGSSRLYFDTNPNHSFSGDSGFTDGAAILTGSVTGGTGSFFPSPGVGFSSFDLSIGTLDYNHSVYTPANIAGGNGIFTLQINPTGVTSSVTSVFGQQVGQDDTLLQADGSLNLVATPVPAALWCLGSALAVLLVGGRRRERVAAA